MFGVTNRILMIRVNELEMTIARGRQTGHDMARLRHAPTVADWQVPRQAVIFRRYPAPRTVWINTPG